ncbi:MAG: hypothetical protein QNJ45_25740 [Ardenticatenaceae bacterium]|nr:hypothetical protein [Ardenticatenaceae bacterium]
MKSLRARLYAFAFITTLSRLAGLSLARWIWIALFVFLAITLLLRLWWFGVVIVAVMLGLRFIYRRARRNGYATFEPIQDDGRLSTIDLLPPHQKVAVRATGMFSAGRREHHVLLRRGELWHIPIDEHAVMVERTTGSYLYQFVQPKYTEKVRAGYFLFGGDRFPGLEVTFFTDWSPQIDYDGIAFYVGGGFAAVKRLKRTIYLAFDDEEVWLMVWKSFAERTKLLNG